MQSHEVGEQILQHTPYGVRAEGTIVVLTLGKANVRMDYETALKLSALLRAGGRIAKKAAGDTSRKILVYGHLTDANADELGASFSADRKSIFNRI
jgi:hypothetical protein